MAFRRELLRGILPFPAGVAMHDWWIAVVALGIRAPIDISRDEMILYRRHGANVSATGDVSGSSLFWQFWMRLKLVSSLIVRLAVWHTSTLFANFKLRG
jgi:hypothetical protein